MQATAIAINSVKKTQPSEDEEFTFSNRVNESKRTREKRRYEMYTESEVAFSFVGRFVCLSSHRHTQVDINIHIHTHSRVCAYVRNHNL